MAYNDLVALKTALGAAKHRAIFDDDNTGEADSDAGPAQILLRAHERVNRSLLVAFGGAMPFTEDDAPNSVKVLELEFAIVMALARAPEYSREETVKALALLDDELRHLSGSFIKVTVDQPSPGPALAVITASGAETTEDASLLRRDGGGALYESRWWRFPLEREGE